MTPMGYGGLQFERMPPLSVPLRFFLVAPVFGAAAGILLAVAGPATLLSRWTPGVLAATHLVTLGFLTMVMVGAIFQVLPVVTGVPVVPTRPVASSTHLLLVVATVLFGLGVGFSRPALSGAAGALAGVALGGFLVAALAAAARVWRNATGRAMGLALVSLLVVLLLGVVLLAGHAGWMPLRRDLTDVHLMWAVAGWVGLLVMGVSFQVVPMFQVTPSYPGVLQDVLPAAVFVGLLLWLGGRLAGWAPIAAAGMVALGLAFSVYAAATLWLQAHRRRKLRDVTTDLWRLAMVLLLLDLLLAALGAVGVVDLAAPRVVVTIGLVLLPGVAVSVIMGMLYKIVPFLTWLRLQARLTERGLVGALKVRNMRQLLPAATARWHLRVHVLAVAALVGAVWLDGSAFAGMGARLAGVALAADFTLLGWNLAVVVERFGAEQARIFAAR